MQHATIDRTDRLHRNEEKYSPRVTVAILASATLAGWGMIAAGITALL